MPNTPNANPHNPEEMIQMHADLIAASKHDEAEELAASMEQRFPGNLDIQLYLGTYYDMAMKTEAADKCFERALKIDPGNPEARRAVAITCLEKNDLSRASDLLSFMKYSSPNQHPWVLFSLATAYQKNGNHHEALSYFQIIARDFPDIAKNDKEFRKAVKKSQRFLGESDYILPRREFAWAGKWKQYTLVMLVLAALLFIYNWYLSTRQTLHVVNQLQARATVTLPGQDPLVIGPGITKTVKVPEGRHNATIQVENLPAETVPVDISNRWLDRFFGKKLFVLNVGRGAVLLWEETTYSENPSPKDPYRFRFHVGESLITFDKVDYKFEPFPKTIKVESGNPKLKTRVDVLPLPPALIPSILKEANIPPGKILTYIEAHLGTLHDDENLHAYYVYLSQADNQLARAAQYLEKGLHQRPVWVEWHRNYQNVSRLAGPHEKLIPQYDAMLQKDSQNPDLLYLRGRLETYSTSAGEYYDRSINANPKNSHPYFAKALDLAGRGELTAAKELCATACQLNPNSLRMKDMFYQLRFALGEYAALEKEVLSVLSINPQDWVYFLRLLDLRIAQKDNTGVQKAWENYQATLKKNITPDTAQYELRGRMHLAYLREDFNTLAREAAALQDASLRQESLKEAYLNLGEMEKAEKLLDLLDPKNTIDGGYTYLLYWLGWLEKGDTQKASPWLEKAIQYFRSAIPQEKPVAELLQGGNDPLNRLDNLTIFMDRKRILYTALARLYPPQRQELLARAEKLNNLYQFPHHFLAKTINQMKKERRKEG